MTSFALNSTDQGANPYRRKSYCHNRAVKYEVAAPYTSPTPSSAVSNIASSKNGDLPIPSSSPFARLLTGRLERFKCQTRRQKRLYHHRRSAPRSKNSRFKRYDVAKSGAPEHAPFI